MKRDELLEHLTAICDAENAAHACQQAIDMLSRLINSRSFYENAGVQFNYPIAEPTEKELVRPDSNNTSFAGGCAMGCALPLCAFLGFAFYEFYIGKSGIMELLSPIIGFGIGALVISYIDDSKRKKEVTRVQNINELNRNDYEQEVAEYEKIKKAWLQQQSKLQNRIRSSIQRMIDENKATLTAIEDRLKKLYDMGIVYSRFQNMVAMNTIREYVEMGLCDKLEGSDGAYGVYLQDLRADKICGSIEDLKRATVNALSVIAQNQAQLIHEVREIDGDMKTLEQSMNQNLSGLNHSMQSIQSDLSDRNKFQAEQTQILSQYMGRMERTLRNAAYNDYIQKRIETTDRYLRTHYRAPNA